MGKIEFNSQSTVAFVRLAVPLASFVAAAFGWALDPDLLTNALLSVLAVALLVWTWWKNNNVTEAAQAAQRVLEAIKAGEEEEEEEEEEEAL